MNVHPRTLSSTEKASPFRQNSIWSSQPADSGNSKSLYYRSASHSAVVRPTSYTQSYSAQVNENAVFDDDEDDNEDMFEEDFVPSSLSDLLTPQELQRRGSRSSFSRPSVAPQIRPTWEIPQTTDVDENEMQFKMDEEIYQNNHAMTGIDMNGLKI